MGGGLTSNSSSFNRYRLRLRSKIRYRRRIITKDESPWRCKRTAVRLVHIPGPLIPFIQYRGGVPVLELSLLAGGFKPLVENIIIVFRPRGPSYCTILLTLSRAAAGGGRSEIGPTVFDGPSYYVSLQ